MLGEHDAGSGEVHRGVEGETSKRNDSTWLPRQEKNINLSIAVR